MTNNEAVEALQNISYHIDIHDTRYILTSKECKAIQHAIKNVALMTELVEELEYSVQCVHDADKLYNALKIWELIDKAKELIE